jgi:hypothetical protein
LGGAVFSVYGVVAVTNCTFSGNKAVGGVGGSLYGSLDSNGMGLGGGLFIVDTSLNVLNGTFAFNQADDGGGLCNLGYGDASSVFIRNTILADTLSNASDYLSTTSGRHHPLRHQRDKLSAASILPRLCSSVTGGGK